MGKVEERRADLRTRLIELAEVQIAQGGIAGLKARDLAKEAGCALGAIYNVFDDMNALVMAVNGRTFKRIGVEVGGAVIGHEAEPPVQRLILLANAYLAFAAENHLLWRTLFDLEMADDGTVPEWYMAELRSLFAHIAKPVAELYPTLASRDLELMVRALFSSVHGMVLLGLQNRISGVPRENIHQMIAQILGLLSPRK
jgi:AcrR family transcriptional regulator